MTLRELINKFLDDVKDIAIEAGDPEMFDEYIADLRREMGMSDDPPQETLTAAAYAGTQDYRCAGTSGAVVVAGGEGEEASRG